MLCSWLVICFSIPDVFQDSTPNFFFQNDTMILSCDDFYRGFPPNNLKYIVKISGEKKNNRLWKK